MAQRKSTRCSTGHGTGVTPPVELRRLLASRTSMFIGRPRGIAQGGVERPERRRAARVCTDPARVGYFRKKRLAANEAATTNLRNLGLWG
jgi:hypothetical protein